MLPLASTRTRKKFCAIIAALGEMCGLADSTPTVAGVVVNFGMPIRIDIPRKPPASTVNCLRSLFASLLVSAACSANALTEEPAEPPVSAPGFLEVLRQGFALNHRLDQPVVLQEIDRVRRSPSYLARLSPRIERYLPAICSEARERGMPAEICLLPIVESAVNPAAVSQSGARGLWQLVPGTAKRYGLKINWPIDERRDPVASTDAALRYLGDLQRRFSDWTLALAAYNCGETTVANVLGGADAGASFFDLRWPTETAVYVPRLLAFAAIFADPSAHGISLPDRLRHKTASLRTVPAVPRARDKPTLALAPPATGGETVYRPASSLRESSTEPIER